MQGENNVEYNYKQLYSQITGKMCVKSTFKWAFEIHFKKYLL